MPNYTAKKVKKIYPVRANFPLKENIAFIIPLIFNGFISMAQTVTSRPKMKNLLHRMRINGKPLRYAMEIGASSFSTEFTGCLAEVKEMLELMGDIHDCDENISELLLYLKELRLFNRTLKNKQERISTHAVIDLISLLRAKRKRLFEKFCTRIDKWQKQNFREKLISAMDE